MLLHKRQNRFIILLSCFWNSALLLLEFVQAWARNYQCQLTGLGESLGMHNTKISESHYRNLCESELCLEDVLHLNYFCRLRRTFVACAFINTHRYTEMQYQYTTTFFQFIPGLLYVIKVSFKVDFFLSDLCFYICFLAFS